MYRQGVAQRSFYVHHLVAAAFIGPRPEGSEVCHGPGGFLDNRAVNLRYDTHHENIRDKIADGTDHNAIKTHCKHGHPFDEANAIYRGSGRRGCRECGRQAQRAYQQRKREASEA